MAKKYHGTGRTAKLPLVRALLATNLLFAVAVLVAWQSTLMVLLGPLGWAADEPVPSSRGWENLFQYPLLVFWAGPALAMAFGWMMIQARNYKAAFGALALPLIMMIIIVVLYWAVPPSA